MFETAILSSGPQTKRVWTTFAGVGGQACLLGVLVLAPLISPQVLPKVVWAMQLAPPTPPPGPLVRDEAPVHVEHIRATHVYNDGFTAPTKVPDHVLIINEPEAPVTSGRFVVGGIPESGSGAFSATMSNMIVSVAPPTVHAPQPVPVVVKPLEPPKPPRITELKMAEPIQRVTPIYPPIARASRISGKVELLGVLGTDGRIHEVRVISGHPFLVKAAVDAVMQWVYRPTILNGQPVEVQAPIIVNFVLN